MPADDGSGALPPGLRHDLLNALNAVLGYAALLVEDLPEGPLRDYAQRIRTAGQEAMGLAECLPTTRRPRVRILLVGENSALTAGLESLAFDVTEAGTTAEALTVIKAAPGDWDHIVLVRPDTRVERAARRAGLPVLHYSSQEPVEALAVRLRGGG